MNNNIIMNTLMNKLKIQNPNAYNQIQSWMQSGANPNEIVNTLLNSGQITQQQLQSAQQMANQMQNSNSQKRF